MDLLPEDAMWMARGWADESIWGCRTGFLVHIEIFLRENPAATFQQVLQSLFDSGKQTKSPDTKAPR